MSERVRKLGALIGRRRGATAGTRTRARGFTLMELMIVVILISILAMLAIPTLGEARYDRHAYDDSGAIMQLYRVARTRALGRGGAVLVRAHADVANGDRGTYELWDAVRPNADVATDAGSGGDNRTPVSSCKSPTQWTLDKTNPATANAIFIDGVNMNGTIEAQGGVESIVMGVGGSAVTSDFFACFTPLGRVYVATGTANFDTAAPSVGTIQIHVFRKDANAAIDATFGGLNLRHQGAVRTVLVPSSGMARTVSR